MAFAPGKSYPHLDPENIPEAGFIRKSEASMIRFLRIIKYPVIIGFQGDKLQGRGGGGGGGGGGGRRRSQITSVNF